MLFYLVVLWEKYVAWEYFNALKAARKEMINTIHMNKLLLIILIIIMKFSLTSAQTYSGVSKQGYHILLKIEKDSSIVYAFSYKQLHYEEYKGRISKVNDSLFHIDIKMIIGNENIRCIRDFISFNDNDLSILMQDNNQLYLDIDTLLKNVIDTVFITYSNGEKVFYSPFNNISDTIHYFLDKNLFNDKPNNDYHFISFNKKNIITNKPLKLIMHRDSSIKLKTGEVDGFDVIVSEDKLSVLNNQSSNIGYFKLQKKNKKSRK